MRLTYCKHSAETLVTTLIDIVKTHIVLAVKVESKLYNVSISAIVHKWTLHSIFLQQ